MADIRFFSTSTEYSFLSNFYQAPIIIEGEEWQTTEAFYQAAKFTDEARRAEIRAAGTPGKTKALGRSRVGFVGSSVWLGPEGAFSGRRDKVMAIAIRAKFTQHEELRRALIETGTRKLVEANVRDPYWGFGKNGCGCNRLGVMLMELRDELGARAPAVACPAEGASSLDPGRSEEPAAAEDATAVSPALPATSTLVARTLSSTAAMPLAPATPSLAIADLAFIPRQVRPTRRRSAACCSGSKRSSSDADLLSLEDIRHSLVVSAMPLPVGRSLSG